MGSKRVKFLDRGQRTFYIGVSGVPAFNRTPDILEVPFVDTAGNLIKCNYFSVQAISHDQSNSDVGSAAVEVSGIAHLGDMELLGIEPVSSTLSPSGICGLGLIYFRLGKMSEWHGSNGQVATGVKIQVKSTINTVVAKPTPKVMLGITYGNLFPLNSRRLEQSYDAGV